MSEMFTQNLGNYAKQASDPGRVRAITVQDMYNKQFKQNLPYGMSEYQPGVHYVDAAKQVKDREYEQMQKKSASSRPKPVAKPSQRGHYLDDLYKQNKLVPGPQKYKLEHDWVTKEMIEKGKRVPKNTERNTYIDLIFKEQKKQGPPGVGKYNVEKTLEQQKADLDKLKEKKIKYNEKISSTDDVVWLADRNPGPGQYNPHKLDEIKKLKVDNTKPDFWIKKHKEESKKGAKFEGPDPGTYKNNYPVEFSTFGKLLNDQKEKPQQGQTKAQNLGTEVRFKDPKKSKSLMTINVPGPGQYQMIADWPGKAADGKKEQKKTQNWMDNVTRGISKSIYY